MKILFAASEGAPFMKTGGLGDVARALPCELAKNPENEIAVVLPYYSGIKYNDKFAAERVAEFGVPLAWRNLYCGLYRYYDKKAKITYFFIDNEYYFSGQLIYGRFDDGERFAYYAKAILEMLMHLDYFPDVIHCNDWQTALVPAFLKCFYSHLENYSRIKTVFTIHNIEYQGKASNEFLTDGLGMAENWRPTMSHLNCINYMKSAILLSDKVTTVSVTYSYEIRHAYFAHGLENVLQSESGKLVGIVNGIDQSEYNPKTDKNIYKNFSAADLSGKAENKKLLQKDLGLAENANLPVFALVSRLVAHKGVELIEFMMDELAALPAQFVILGSGDTKHEHMFSNFAKNNSKKVSVTIGFDSQLASRIYAGADFLLMPSKSEPCGLSQLIAMRYGTIPVVRETGGLCDTVPPINMEDMSGAGFTFKLFNAHDMCGAVRRAVDFYGAKDKLKKIMVADMKLDLSWKKSAAQYMDVYRSLF